MTGQEYATIQERRRVGRRRFDYVRANVFEAMLAVAAIVAGVRFFFDPEAIGRGVIGKLANPVDEMWSSMYLLAGVFILVGLIHSGHTVHWRKRFLFCGEGLEVAGLIFLTTAALANVAAVAWVRGFDGVEVTLVAIIVATLVRIQILVSKVNTSIPMDADL